MCSALCICWVLKSTAISHTDGFTMSLCLYLYGWIDSLCMWDVGIPMSFLDLQYAFLLLDCAMCVCVCFVCVSWESNAPLTVFQVLSAQMIEYGPCITMLCTIIILLNYKTSHYLSVIFIVK